MIQADALAWNGSNNGIAYIEHAGDQEGPRRR